MHEHNYAGVFRPRSAIVSAAFGAIWLIAWWHQATPASLMVLFVISASVTIVIGAALVQLRRFRGAELALPSAYRASRLRLYGVVNAIYWPFVGIAVVALGATGNARWINPAIIFLVGMHMFPLGRIFQDWLLHLTGVLLVALAVVYPVLAGPTSPAGLFGAGATLVIAGAVAIVADSATRSKSHRGVA